MYAIRSYYDVINEPYPQRDNVYYGMMEGIISKPELWNSENPYLYTLVMKLTDKSGKVVVITSYSIHYTKLYDAWGYSFTEQCV